jgi:multiple sugar transport system permease protein
MPTRRRSWSSRIWLGAAIALIVLYSGFPVYWMVITALRATKSLFTTSLLPGPFGLDSFRTLFTLTNFPRYLLNSVIVSVSTTFLTVVIATPMAYALVRGRVRGAQLLVRGMLFAYMFPALLLAIPIEIFLVRTHLDNSLMSLTATYLSFTLPLAVWLLWSFFKTFPFAIEEAALVDGCTRWQSLYKVVVPISLPGMLTVTLFSFLLAWSDFVFPMIMTSDDDKRTVLYGLTQISDTYNADWGVLMAGASLAALPVVLILMGLGRFFVRGLSEGAVK